MQGIMVRRQLQNKQKEMFNLMVEQQQRQVQCLEIMKLHHLQSRLHQDGGPPPMLRKEEDIKSPGGIASKPDGAVGKGVSFSGFENKGVSGSPIRLNENNCFDDNVVDLSVHKNVEVVHESDEKLPENTESEGELSIET